MVQVRTNLTSRESARGERFEPTGNVTSTNVQGAIQQVDTEAAGKVTKVGTVRKPASAATIAILSSDIEVGIDTRSTAVTATLPSAAAWANANPNGLELVLADYFGNAAANSITPQLFAGDHFNGVWDTTPPVINANGGALKLRPDPSLPGWIVRGVN
ncbi:MAG TPA: hypothetical protein VEU47_10945 [Candidatus Cybelea sp.]|nr:hypothetical protein [Candidatus Cybelea sp.]